MSTITQIFTKEKAFAMINSCESQDHFNGTLKYIELYYKKFEDCLGYNELKQHYRKVQLKSLNQGNEKVTSSDGNVS